MSQTSKQTAPSSTGPQATLADLAAREAGRLGITFDQFVALGISSILSGLEGCDANDEKEFVAEARRLA